MKKEWSLPVRAVRSVGGVHGEAESGGRVPAAELDALRQCVILCQPFAGLAWTVGWLGLENTLCPRRRPRKAGGTKHSRNEPVPLPTSMGWTSRPVARYDKPHGKSDHCLGAPEGHLVRCDRRTAHILRSSCVCMVGTGPSHSCSDPGAGCRWCPLLHFYGWDTLQRSNRCANGKNADPAHLCALLLRPAADVCDHGRHQRPALGGIW